MLNKIINGTFDKLGYKIAKNGKIEGFNLFNPGYLSKICNPKTVIDVGVGFGTHLLYQSFPTSYFILIEPIEEYKSSIDEILLKYKGEVHYKAIGHEAGTIELDVDIDDLQLSSHFKRTELTLRNNHRIEKRKVEIVSLDILLNPINKLKRPIVLKVDTEGNELNVLKGSKLLLKSTDFVIAEASIAKRFENSYEFDELVTFMRKNGFIVFSILSIGHSAKEIRPRFADVVFSRSTS